MYACAHCGDPVSARGTTAADGKRFCTSKRDCINAKQALRRAQRLGPPAMERRPCSSCGAQLPARPARKTDTVLGRWCRESRVCQEARTYAIAHHMWKMSVLDEAPVVECPTCGLVDAREDWMHLDPNTFELCDNGGAWPKAIDHLVAIKLWNDVYRAAAAHHAAVS